MLLVAALFACFAADAAALAPSTAQVPAELRPAQGPPGSSTIVFAAGFGAEEEVRVSVDGVPVAPLTALDEGTVSGPVAMPDAPGPHRVELYGTTTRTAAAGTFTTTATGAARPAVLLSPRPSIVDETTGKLETEIHAVNFGGSSPLTLRCFCGQGSQVEDGYASISLGTTGAGGDGTFFFEWSTGSYGVFEFAVSQGAPADAGPILAADSVIRPDPNAQGATADPGLRARAVPAVGSIAGGSVFIVGSGFTPGQQIVPDEDTELMTPVVADAAGGVVTEDEDLDRDDDETVYPTSALRLTQGTSFAGVGFARSTEAVPPTAGVTHELVAPGASFRVAAVGLPAGTATFRGLDAHGRLTTLGESLVEDGTAVSEMLTVPADASPGAYRVEVASGSTSAYASLSVAGAITPTLDLVGPSRIVMPSTGGAVDRSVTICNRDAAERPLDVTESASWLTVGPTPPVLAPGACAAVTVSATAASPEQGSAPVTVTAQGATDAADETETVVVRRLLRDAAVTQPTDGTAIYSDELAAQPLALSGTSTGDVVVVAVPDGEQQPLHVVGQATPAPGGAWSTTISSWAPGRGRWRLVALPAEVDLEAGPERTGAVTAYGPGRLLVVEPTRPVVDKDPGEQTPEDRDPVDKDPTTSQGAGGSGAPQGAPPELPPAPVAAVPPAVAGPVAPRLVGALPRLRGLRSARGVPVTVDTGGVSCRPRCRVTVALLTRGRRARAAQAPAALASGSVAVTRGGRTTVRVVASRKARRRLARLRSLKVTIRITVAVGDGRVITARRAVTLKR